jgi:GTP-binding protein
MYGKNLILTDTAGIRRKSRVKDKIEFYSVMRSIDALQNSDVSIIMIDAQSGIESQDMNLISLATKYKKGILIMVNKWDLVEKDHKTHDDYKKDLLQKIAPFNFIPVVFTSVINKKRINQVLELAVNVYNERQKKVSTSKLNEALLPEIERYPPPAVKGKYIKIKYITQLPTKTPTFAFFCNLPQYIKSAYERYLENKLRHHFGFEGVPVKLVFRKK